MASSLDLKRIFNETDQAIVQGNIRLAAELIESIYVGSLSRKESLVLAQLFRRIGNIEQGLKILNPIVRPKGNLDTSPTDQEKAEYAICLQRAGSLEEAKNLIGEVHVEKAPEALLFNAILHFSNWNYKDAIPLLHRLLSLVSSQEYLHRLGRLNLAAAYVIEDQLDEAQELLKGVIGESSVKNEHLLTSNALEVSAQIAIQKRDYDLASHHLERADRLLKGVRVLDYLWIIKWKGILEALKSQSLEPLKNVRQEAMRKNHWESLREVDFYHLQIQFDLDLFYKVYFGTKSPFYRIRLISLRPDLILPEFTIVTEDWKISKETENALDLFWDLKGDLAPGGLAHALLILLLSDWYRGFRSGELHSILFCGDFFNPDTSLNRVHQMVTRLRKAIEDQLPGIELHTEGSIYFLRINSKDLKLKIPKNLPNPDPISLRIFAFQQRFSGTTFSSEDIQEVFKLSKSAANKLLKQWKEHRQIEVSSNEISPKYHFSV